MSTANYEIDASGRHLIETTHSQTTYGDPPNLSTGSQEDTYSPPSFGCKHCSFKSGYFITCKVCEACMYEQQELLKKHALREMAVNNWPRVLLVTLTYRDSAISTASAKNVHRYLNSLRRSGVKLAYIATNEYGEKTGRYHHHILLFANSEATNRKLERTRRRITPLHPAKRKIRKKWQDRLRKLRNRTTPLTPEEKQERRKLKNKLDPMYRRWPHGNIQVKPVQSEKGGINAVIGYVTKYVSKSVRSDAQRRIENRDNGRPVPIIKSSVYWSSNLEKLPRSPFSTANLWANRQNHFGIKVLPTINFNWFDVTREFDPQYEKAKSVIQEMMTRTYEVSGETYKSYPDIWEQFYLGDKSKIGAAIYEAEALDRTTELVRDNSGPLTRAGIARMLHIAALSAYNPDSGLAP